MQIRVTGGPEHSVSVSESTRRGAAACSTLPQRSALSRDASKDPNGVCTTHHESSQKGTQNVIFIFSLDIGAPEEELLGVVRAASSNPTITSLDISMASTSVVRAYTLVAGMRG